MGFGKKDKPCEFGAGQAGLQWNAEDDTCSRKAGIKIDAVSPKA